MSFLKQTEKNIEVLVINDGSTDKTIDILNGIHDERLRVITIPRTGRAGALFFACKEARGIYIANLDADDISYPDRLEKQTSFLDNNSEYAWIGSGEEQEDDRREEHFKRIFPLQDREIRLQSAKCIPYCHSAIMFRQSLIEEGINYDPTQPFLIDFEFFQRVAKNHKVANLPEVLVKRNVSKKSYFQRTYKTSSQNRRLSWLCSLAIWRFHLPFYCYFFPIFRIFYPMFPNRLKRWIRNNQGLSESYDYFNSK